MPLQDAVVGETRATLLVLLGATGLLLLVACVNVINLLLSRMADRGQEIRDRLEAVLAECRRVLSEDGRITMGGIATEISDLAHPRAPKIYP